MIKCKICNKEFKIRPSRLKYGKKFCSKKCYSIAQKKFYIGEKAANWQGGKIKRYCYVYGKEFYRDKNEIKNSACIYCSLKCRDEDYKKRFKLEKNPAWFGGKSFEPYGIQFNKELKKKIKERDNYKCQICGMPEKELKKDYIYIILIIRSKIIMKLI